MLDSSDFRNLLFLIQKLNSYRDQTDDLSNRSVSIVLDQSELEIALLVLCERYVEETEK